MTQVSGTQVGTAVSTKVAGMFTPVIDLNDSSLNESSINKKFDLAVVEAKDFIVKSKNSKLQNEEKSIKNVMYGGAAGIVALGLLAPFAIAAATAVVSVSIAGVTAIAFYGYCKYRLPFKMKALEAELSVRMKQLESDTLIRLNQVKLDHLKNLKAQAKANPVEIRQKIANENRVRLEKGESAINAGEGFIDTQKNKIEEHKKKFPDDTLISTIERGINKFEELVTSSKLAIQTAYKKLERYEYNTEMIESQLILATGMKNIAEALSVSGVETKIDEILSAIAKDTAEIEFATSMAAVKDALSALNRQNMLESNTSSQENPSQQSQIKE